MTIVSLGKAEAVSHGAATIINAIATGGGAAFGVNLWTKALVELTDDPNVIKGEITSDPSENPFLIERATFRVLKYFRVEKKFGATVKTTSNIPIARGLKSSSAAANAVVLAATAALGQSLEDWVAVNLGVDAAFDAKVTVTGAFDDACASYYGGIVVTDNLRRKIVMRTSLPEKLSVLFQVPSQKAYTSDSDVNKLKTIAPMIKIVYKEALMGNFWAALSLNGIIYSSALGYDTSVALAALRAGAVASGLCGKGPSVTAVVSDDKIDLVQAALQRFEGKIIYAQMNGEKAKAVT